MFNYYPGFTPFHPNTNLSGLSGINQFNPRRGLISSLSSRFNFRSILGGAQKFIFTANQIIPLYHQVRPMIKNVGVLFKVKKAINNLENEPVTSPLQQAVDSEEKRQSSSVNPYRPERPFIAEW